MFRKVVLGAVVLFAASAIAQDNVAGGGSGGAAVKTNNTSAGTRVELHGCKFEISRPTDIYNSPNLSDPVFPQMKDATAGCSAPQLNKAIRLAKGKILPPSPNIAVELFTSSTTKEKFYALRITNDGCADPNQTIYIPVNMTKAFDLKACGGN